MKLYNGRNKIIKISEDKSIKPTDFPHNPKSGSESESVAGPPFEEGIQERTKMRKQKESDEENQERQGIELVTPNQMLCRLPIALVQLKAGNNSEKMR